MNSKNSNNNNASENATLDLFADAMLDFEAERDTQRDIQLDTQREAGSETELTIPTSTNINTTERSQTSQALHASNDLTWLKNHFGIQVDTDLEDGQARFAGINPHQSYIVQAPAGSGKTSLLAQRFLALLSQVEYPEQIVAMTFTKKAAAEMRERIIEALQFGLQDCPAEALLVQKNTWQLAKKALQRDHEKGWNLIQNANRLRIKTIDGLNSYLVGQMPLLSKVGGQPQLLQDATPAYQEAVRNVLKMPEMEEAVGRLLRLVNGRFNSAENLLVSMLQKRDQWMRTLIQYQGDEARDILQAALQEIVAKSLKQNYAHIYFLQDSFAEICALAEYAMSNGQEQLQPLCGAWPLNAELESVAAWRTLANWILKNDGTLRKTVNKNNGFITGKGEPKENKDRFLEALENIRVAAANDSEVLPALVALKGLPDPEYSDQQWQDLQWLIQLLTMGVAHLKMVFQQQVQADYIEIAQAASTALGSELEPTDLAQQLDYQIQHLLVDEFQDTSSEQYRLLTQLIAGWQVDDGRTLFLVGDPMQSIYRFREAEVGNFLKAWQGKVGSVSLQPLNLSVNFRSAGGVVNWVNEAFEKILPAANDIEKGAVTYTRSSAFSQCQKEAVFSNFKLNRKATEEAFEIVELIKKRLAELAPENAKNNENNNTSHDAKLKKIAVLGRSRSSLLSIAQLLKQQGVGFRAVELESLAERQEVQDMLALSRSLLHLADKAAWIALLRSPLVGINLPDLTHLIGDMPYQTAWQAIQRYQVEGEKGLSSASNKWDFAQNSAFSAEAIQRLESAIPILEKAIKRLGGLPFASLLRDTWLQLDGPLAIENAMALENVEVFCHTLAEAEAPVINLQQLEQQMQSLFARPDSQASSQQIELMTMHKSKGLEFDTVILPGLARKPRGDDTALVSWFQFKAEEGSEQLVIAPLDQKGQSTSRLRELLKSFEKEKQRFELGRLFYVAATRAKSQLHLFADIKYQPSEKELEAGEINLKLNADSLLESMWDYVKPNFVELAKHYEPLEQTDIEIQAVIPKVNRLPLEREGFKQLEFTGSLVLSNVNQPSNPIAGLTEPRQSAEDNTKLDNESASEPLLFSQKNALLNTTVGNLVHAIFEQMVSEDLNQWQTHTQVMLQQRLPIYQQWLCQQGLPDEHLPEALRRVQQSLSNAMQNSTVCWALQNSHMASATEFPLTSLDETGVANHIVDRTFIDEKGTRWIIDYKTSVYDKADEKPDEKANEQGFINKQIEKYQPQLKRYGQLFNQLEQRPQKWVLYFSYLDKWIEVETCH